MNDIPPATRLWGSIAQKDISSIRAICAENPEVVGEHIPTDDLKHKESWMCCAALHGNPEVVQTFIQLGFNVNALNLPERESAISVAIFKADMEMLRLLLSRGANPNFGRPIISAMKCKDASLRLPTVRLLVEHGLNVNKLFDLYGDVSKSFTALDWARDPEIIEYLKSHGAKSAAELKMEESRAASDMLASESTSPATPASEVIAYFEKTFGPVDERSIIEIVPSGDPVAVHVIKPQGNRKHLTLFTTGLSDRPMKTPPGQEKFSLAELFIELPGDWKLDVLNDPNWGWPVHWLRKIAQYPHSNQTWLGGPLTIIANDDPPQPLAPNTRMTSLLLLAEKSFVRRDDKTVQLYRVTPLYTEERDLELRGGAAALMRAFDRKSVPYFADVHRPSIL